MLYWNETDGNAWCQSVADMLWIFIFSFFCYFWMWKEFSFCWLFAYIPTQCIRRPIQIFTISYSLALLALLNFNFIWELLCPFHLLPTRNTSWRSTLRQLIEYEMLNTPRHYQHSSSQFSILLSADTECIGRMICVSVGVKRICHVTSYFRRLILKISETTHFRLLSLQYVSSVSTLKQASLVLYIHEWCIPLIPSTTEIRQLRRNWLLLCQPKTHSISRSGERSNRRLWNSFEKAPACGQPTIFNFMSEKKIETMWILT